MKRKKMIKIGKKDKKKTTKKEKRGIGMLRKLYEKKDGIDCIFYSLSPFSRLYKARKNI